MLVFEVPFCGAAGRWFAVLATGCGRGIMPIATLFECSGFMGWEPLTCWKEKKIGFGTWVKKKEFFFSPNEARKLLKTKDGRGKNGQNEPKTKLKRSRQVVENT